MQVNIDVSIDVDVDTYRLWPKHILKRKCKIPMKIRIQMLIPIQMQNIPNPHLRIQTQRPIQILSTAAEHSPLLGSMGRQLISGDEPPPSSDHNNIC